MQNGFMNDLFWEPQPEWQP